MSSAARRKTPCAQSDRSDTCGEGALKVDHLAREPHARDLRGLPGGVGGVERVNPEA